MLGPMKQNSKYDPAIEALLLKMDKKTRVMKTRTVKRYKMSKEQYSKLAKEIRFNSNYHFDLIWYNIMYSFKNSCCPLDAR